MKTFEGSDREKEEWVAFVEGGDGTVGFLLSKLPDSGELVILAPW